MSKAFPKSKNEELVLPKVMFSTVTESLQLPLVNIKKRLKNIVDNPAESTADKTSKKIQELKNTIEKQGKVKPKVTSRGTFSYR